MLLHEKRPVPPSRGNGGAEVAKVPRQDDAAPGSSHRHHATVDEVETRPDVSFGKIERMTMLGFGKTIQLVNAFEETPPEDESAPGMAAGAEDEVDFHVDRPGYENAPPERCQETSRELVALALGAVASRDEGPAVTDDQPARRERTSSIRSDRSGSSSINPA